MSPGKRLGEYLKKSNCNFHFKPTSDFFETKIKTFMGRLGTSLCRLGCGLDTVNKGLRKKENEQKQAGRKKLLCTKCILKCLQLVHLSGADYENISLLYTIHCKYTI